MRLARLGSYQGHRIVPMASLDPWMELEQRASAQHVAVYLELFEQIEADVE